MPPEAKLFLDTHVDLFSGTGGHIRVGNMAILDFKILPREYNGKPVQRRWSVYCWNCLDPRRLANRHWATSIDQLIGMVRNMGLDTNRLVGVVREMGWPRGGP